MMSYINETDFVIENKELVYPEIVTDGLQLYYDAKGKRDTDYHRDTMLDMSGNKNHGKLHNFAYEKHSGYKDGLVFDYIDDKLVRPTLDGIDANNFTYQLNSNILAFTGDEVKTVKNGSVEVGGRNLQRDVTEGYSETVNNVTVVDNRSLLVEYQVNSASSPYVFIRNTETLHEGQEYTLSFYATLYRNSRVHLNFGLRNSGGFPDQGQTLEPEVRTKITHTFKPTGNGRPILILFTGPTAIPQSILFEDMKLEKGSIATDWTPALEDLIETTELKGNILGDMENIIDGLYKTEVLSDEEIYTDKADDALVHVEVDGKSYQHAGSGKNMFNKYLLSDRSKFELATYSSSPAIQLKPNTTHVLSASRVNPSPDGNQLVLNIMDATGGIPAYGSPEYNDKRIKAVFNMYGEHSGFDDFRAVFSTPESGLIFFSYYDNNLGKSSEGNWFTDVMIDAQLEEGSVVTEYEPPVQSPEYPIKIKSLNDFDVVSSVGKRNLLSDTGNIAQRSNNTSIQPIEDEVFGLHRRFRRTPGANNALSNYTAAFYDTEIGKNYTQSIEVNPEKTVTLRIRSGTSTICPAGQWTTLYNVVTATSNKERYWGVAGNNVFDESGNGIWIEYRNEKVEEGNISTPYSPALENITGADNHPLIDKINLLLDEPLRSAVNAKDRLFRDSDGLWKVERNVKEMLLDGSETWTTEGSFQSVQNYAYTGISDMVRGTKNIIASSLILAPYASQVMEGWNTTSVFIINLKNERTGILPEDSISKRGTKFKKWVKDNPFTIVYELAIPSIETLPQSLQDKLNNLRSFQDSNYIYTVLPNEDNHLSDNLEPTLHAKFLYNNWYKEDRVINNLMIYNRALTNEEMLQNYKTIKRRWGM